MITTMDGLVAGLTSGQRFIMQKSSITTVGGYYYTLWSAAGNPSAGTLSIGNTTSGLIPTDSTTGSMVINAFTGTNTGYLASFDASTAQAGVISMYDRIWHAGSILINSLATTTFTGQPAFTRVPNNDYTCLELWLECNVACSATATTVTVSYQDGAASPEGGNTRTATIDTSVTGMPANRMLPFRMANSLGIQKVNSITIGGTVGTAGSVNLVVQRNIVDHTVVSANIGRPKKNAFDTGLPVVYADSCLALMFNAVTTSSGVLYVEGSIING